jgi:hypothetical protein
MSAALAKMTAFNQRRSFFMAIFLPTWRVISLTFCQDARPIRHGFGLQAKASDKVATAIGQLWQWVMQADLLFFYCI